MPPYEHRAFGRNRKTLFILLAIYAALIIAVVQFNAAWWIIAIAALCTLPALWDLYSNRAAGITLTDTHLTWHAGARSEQIAYADIDKIRLDTRLDLSVRVTILRTQGGKRRLPHEATPDHKTLETELNARGLKTERHHFSLMS